MAKDIVDIKTGKPIEDPDFVGKGAPFTPPEMLASNGEFQYDERNKRIVSPQGQYIGGSQVTEILNQMAKSGQLLLDIHQAIEVILFGRTPDGGDIDEAPVEKENAPDEGGTYEAG